MDDAVSEIIAEYATKIDAQERIAQAEAAVVEAAMAAWHAEQKFHEIASAYEPWEPWQQAMWTAQHRQKDACAALAKARGEA